PARQPGPAGGDHPGDQRDRLRVRRPGRQLSFTPHRRIVMTTTANETPAAAAGEPGVGRIARVIGPVLDIEFPPDALPEMYNALKTTIDLGGEKNEITLETAQHLGDNLVRAVALKPTDGLVRGGEVRDTGAPISVPVGDITKGKVFNVTGDALNLPEGETLEVTERWPIHREPPEFDQLESKTQM